MPRIDPSTPADAPEPVPKPLLSVGLVALGALAVSRRQAALPIASAVMIVVSLLLPVRMRAGAPLIRTTRVLVYGVALALLLMEPAAGNDAASYLGHYIDAALQLCALELALQCWQWPRWGGDRAAVFPLLASFVVVAACRTFESRFFPPLVALYFATLVWALRATRPRGESPGRGALWVASPTCVVLLLGLAGATLVNTYRKELANVKFQLATTLQGQPRGLGLVSAPVLGATHNPEQSLARVLRVEGTLPATQFMAFGAAGLHLRGMTFDSYARGVWGPSLESRSMLPVALPTLRAELAGNRLTVTRLVDNFRLLPAPLQCAGINPLGRRHRLELSDDFGSPLQSSDWLGAPYSYEVIFSTDANHQGPLCSRSGHESLARCLNLPATLDPRVRQLADSIGGQLPHPLERVHAVTTYLRENHRYSMSVDAGSGDVVTNFLLEKKAGHCEYFASAAVILLRCLKVPSRYVTGFYAHESDASDVMIVRERDSHAWVESWIDGVGWITVEATPPEGRPDRATAPVPFWRRGFERLQDWAASTHRVLGAGLWALCAVVVLGLAVIVWMRQRRLRELTRRAASGQLVYTQAEPQLADMAVRFEHFLLRKGLPCPPHVPWADHVRRASMLVLHSNIDWRQVDLFLNAYNGVRFGQKDDRARALDDLQRCLRKLGG